MAENKKQLIEVKNFSKYFKVDKGTLKAVDNLTFTIYQNETFGLVGESGCGKSTLGRTLMGVYTPTSGSFRYTGRETLEVNKKNLFRYSKLAQMIFQDPYASLDPRMTVGSIIEEGIGIARALAIEPEFIVCDEPISALDVSIQSQVINLLSDLQKKLNLTYLFIAHDLNIVKYISDRIAVMYLGNIVELATSDELYQNTLHPYSTALLSAVPIPDPDQEAQKSRQIIEGEIPSPINPPPGCNFAPRCPKACDICRKQKPALKEVKPGHFVACHFVNKK